MSKVIARSLQDSLNDGKANILPFYPLSFVEMANHHGLLEERRQLNHRLVYGYYPEIINNPGEEEIRLKHLSSSYLDKDILAGEKVQKPEKMEKLVQALAFQVGGYVSYNELAQLTGLNNHTIEKYIDLLEKSLIIFRITALCRNFKDELKKSHKLYFYDNGFRNAVINKFSPVGLRQDMAILWQNFVISERFKLIKYQNINCDQYFWRTYAQQRIDYIEERNGIMKAYEIKWNVNAKGKFPQAFLNAYEGTETKVITPDNIDEFLM